MVMPTWTTRSGCQCFCPCLGNDRLRPKADLSHSKDSGMTEAIDRDAFRDFERQAHHRLADSYHEFFVPVTEHAAEPLLSAAGVRSGMRVIDVACGSGVIAKHAAKRGAIVTGVDLAPRMLELASKLNPDCTFREASVDSMPFKDGAFDAL